jgi:hypothetical protein
MLLNLLTNLRVEGAMVHSVCADEQHESASLSSSITPMFHVSPFCTMERVAWSDMGRKEQ